MTLYVVFFRITVRLVNIVKLGNAIIIYLLNDSPNVLLRIT